MRSFVAALLGGGCVGALLPAASLLSASAELIAFITLIMAGLLPAMMLTATTLRGDAFSVTRVKEYGAQLRRQLRFWAVLFLFALISAVAICAAKVVAQDPVLHIHLAHKAMKFSTAPAVQAVLAIGFAALAVVVVRLYPAYKGLQSLLGLTITMAETQALANDRSLGDALDAKVARAAGLQKTESVGWSDEHE